jgi:tRNA(fMet)-specific endonuclease VapC
MSGDKVALDTNVAIPILNNQVDLLSWAQRFDEICLPLPVVGELYFGAANSRRPRENHVQVEALVARCRILEARFPVARTYAQIRLRLKQKGRPIPENDLWIAAICIEQGIPLASFDHHLQEVDGLALSALPSVPPLGSS